MKQPFIFRILNHLELEWKMSILALLLMLAFAASMQWLFIERLTVTLEQSVDPRLDNLLRTSLTSAPEKRRAEIIAGLERNRQWQAVIPLVVKEQRQTVVGFSLILFAVLTGFAFWISRRLTRPLRNLAFAVNAVGKGETVEVPEVSGGALGRLESSIGTLQRERDILREQARFQGMNEAWQDIARVMAHEIKNPLTPIRLTLDRLEEKSISGKQLDTTTLHTGLERIGSQIDTLERLVDQFRSFSREPDVHVTVVSLDDHIDTIAHDMKKTLVSTRHRNATALVDPYLLDQVLLNIWKNAAEAGATTVTATVTSTNDTVSLDITDNGPGLDTTRLERALLPYVSMKKGGTGLGLAVVKNLVETMKGHVVLSSTTTGENHGLTVHLTFPPPLREKTTHA